ncbi:hypothetical protein K2173_012456 [Erythroxylum novogranatense]|uniref:Uncharacterized protein n=1 Tax=Erythroxylum novogranatense TaxID=1862640 RepID=A0AAV8SLZ6_9ROSI|nr:hypothetical protein K2173_012456 [Erythroxylum novogranatense]
MGKKKSKNSVLTADGAASPPSVQSADGAPVVQATPSSTKPVTAMGTTRPVAQKKSGVSLKTGKGVINAIITEDISSSSSDEEDENAEGSQDSSESDESSEEAPADQVDNKLPPPPPVTNVVGSGSSTQWSGGY